MNDVLPTVEDEDDCEDEQKAVQQFQDIHDSSATDLFNDPEKVGVSN